MQVVLLMQIQPQVLKELKELQVPQALKEL
jgi:hypothetical protein